MNPSIRKASPWLFLAVLTGVVFFLRMPSYSNSFCDPDLTDAAYNAMLLLNGHHPYADGLLSKPPGTIFLYAANFLFFGYQILSIHLLAAAWAVASVCLLFFVGRRVLNPAAGMAAAGLYAFYQADIMSAGACANYEYWTILPAIICLLLAGRRNAGPRLLAAAGFCAGYAMSMKQTAVLFALAGAILVFVNAPAPEENRRLLAALRRLCWYAIGVAACLMIYVAVLAIFSFLGPAAAELNPFRLGRYLASYQTAARCAFAEQQIGRFFFSNAALVALMGLTLVATAALSSFRKYFRVCLGAWLFLLAALGSASAGGHFFGHNFVVIFPFLCLPVGLFFGWIVERRRRGLTALAAALLIGGTLFDALPEIELASASTAGLIRHGSVLTESIFDANRENKYERGYPTEFVSYLEWQPTLKQVSEYLRAHLKPGRAVWTYDYFGEIYFFTRTFAPTRHQENFEIVTSTSQSYYGLWHNSLDPDLKRNRDELMADLNRNPPQFIIRLTPRFTFSGNGTDRNFPGWPVNIYGKPMAVCLAKADSFPELDAFLVARYRLVSPPVNPDIDLYELMESE